MKILIFTEGTILMHEAGKGLPREELIKQVEEKLQVFMSTLAISQLKVQFKK